MINKEPRKMLDCDAQKDFVKHTPSSAVRKVKYYMQINQNLIKR